ncbi:MAG TPA: YoaK family protein [Acidimicrobiales bacterium]
MQTHRSLIRNTVRQFTADPRDGRLPALLLALTVVTGLVDAVSILELGRVFVANMTGNIVFIGFAVASAPGFSLTASLIALAGFLAGAGAGGPLTRRLGSSRTRLLAITAGTELVLVGTATIVVAAVAIPLPSGARDAVAGLLALAMGVQNTTARSLAVPDLTTTVLTMTLTGIASDVRAGATPTIFRRLLSVAAMLAGAAIGALLVIHSETALTLAIAVGLLLMVGAMALQARTVAPEAAAAKTPAH